MCEKTHETNQGNRRGRRPASSSRANRNLLASFRHAAAGLAHVFRTQRNLRLQAVATAAVVAAAIWFRATPLEWLLLILVAGCVITLEMVNTALETVVDMVTSEYREQARLAKDIAAAAVLLMALVAVIVGLVIFLPKLR